MTVPIRAFADDDKARVVSRRLAGDTKGLGYWSARDAGNSNQRRNKRRQKTGS